MNDVVIGIDTSCYTTSAAAVTIDGRVIISSRKLLPVKMGDCGLRQSEMVFHHTKQLPERIREVSDAIHGYRIAAVCASARPRDPEDSYMPAFHVGDAAAQNIAALLGVPCFASTHQRGHVYAAKVDSGIQTGDLLAVHLSGGTTQVLAMRSDELSLIGHTLDLHAGQVVDRVGVALGLRFPAGPHLQQMAMQGKAAAILPANLTDGDLNCHFSGAESKLQRLIASGGIAPDDAAAQVFDLLARTLSRMITAASEKTGIRQVLVAGGVSSSVLFRKLLRERMMKRDRDLSVYFGKPEYSGDNAVGAALIGVQKLLAQRNNGGN